MYREGGGRGGERGDKATQCLYGDDNSEVDKYYHDNIEELTFST